MNDELLLSILEEIFRSVLNNNTLLLDIDSSPNDIEEWDSLNQLNLIKAIEERFKIKFNLAEILEFEQVNDIMTAILAKLPEA